MAKLQSMNILITGTSSGFGFLTAVHLASKGHTVYATMRDIRKMDYLTSEVKKKGHQIRVLPLDVTQPDSIHKVIKIIATEQGYLDAVVNNAGYGIGGFFEDLTDEEIRQQMEVNFFGVQNVTRAVIPLMRSRRKGIIINISSIAGLNASPCFGAYNASKWALEGFSESLHHEMKMFGIHVCMIEPGTYRTKIFFDNAKYAKNFENPQSPYFAMSQHLKNMVLEYVKKTDKDPIRIAHMVERLLIQKNPNLRNFPDIETQLLLSMRRILPFRIYSGIMQRALFQDKIF
jgi:short-subunit dehydrogenase